ncbi:MAG: cell division protein ZipA [Gammaproteobacteria bacterium]|nr:cell division protein ZipA [Gammaproteobacteria bacterium]
MDDLRWILLLVGAVVLVAVYFSGRFEREDWAREHRQSRTGRDKTEKKAGRKDTVASQSTVTEHSKVRKEPAMGIVEPELIAKKPGQDEPGVASSVNLPEAKLAAKPLSPTVPPEPVTKTDQDMDVEHKSEAANVECEHFTIEDEITGIDIPADLTMAEAEIRIVDTVVVEEPEQTAMPPGIEPLVLSVSVFAEEDMNFSGPEIKEALEAEGLLHGAMHIFHFHAPDKKDVSENDDAVFSVASVLEPGFFDLEKLDEMQTPGLMLFCQLPGPLSGDVALEMMLDKGRGLAVRLHGYMCDDKRNRFTTQAKNHYLDRIAVFKRELMLARKKTSAN